MKVILASKNQHKLTELSAILSGLGFEIALESEYGLDIDVDETGTTFEENSLLKAEAVMKASGLPVLADDSGLMVDSLDGAPGIYSARYGHKNSDAERIGYLLANLKDVPAGSRAAKFVCVITCLWPDGRKIVRFEPVSAWETPGAMEALCDAFQTVTQDAELDSLLLIPIFILDFLCIHPFRDGNGRMSRLLSLLLLYKNGFDAGKYVSFEEQINNYKAYYYEALRQSSVGWEAGENSYFPFVENFLSTLYMCYKELDKRFAVVHGKKITKKARVEATVLNSLTPLSKAEICKILPDVSPTTVEAVLGAMVKTGSVKRIGSGRATRYIKV